MAITLDGNNANTVGVINSGTAVASTSGTSIDFTGIPAGVKRITVMFQGVSTNGSSVILIQVGAGSVQTTGYLGSATNFATGVATSNFTTGVGLSSGNSAAEVRHGSFFIQNITGNAWVIFGGNARSDSAAFSTGAGSVSLSATLDRIRITTVNGTDTFDAGTINIIYE